MDRAPLLARWWDRLRSGLWFAPGAAIVTAVLLAAGLIWADNRLGGGGWWIYAGGPQVATAALTTIASSMITFIGLVFSILIVALQLTSSQFSPRALRNFLRDRTSQLALAVFVGTFTYAFAALTAIRFGVGDEAGFVPGLTVTAAFVLVAASILVFVVLIHHTAQSIRAVSIIGRIAAEARETLEELYPPDGEEPAVPVLSGSRQTISAARAGVITDVDLGGLARRAAEVDAVVEVLHPVGSFVCEGMPILRVWCGRASLEGELGDLVHQAQEPTMRGDLTFGFRQLVDIGERSLSPGVNDPTTAIQCLDRIHDLLRVLTARPVATSRVVRVDERIRAWQPAPSYAQLLHLGLDEIRHWGSQSPRVHNRLSELVEDLLAVASRPDRRRSLLDQRELLAARRDDLPPSEVRVLDGAAR